MANTLLFSLFLVLAASAQAQDLSAQTDSNEKAVTQTQAVLRDQAQSENLLSATPEGQKTKQQIDSVMGKDGQELYSLSAEIFPELAAQAGGDPEKMKQLLGQALKNPEAFANSLSPATQKKISDLAKKRDVATSPSAE